MLIKALSDSFHFIHKYQFKCRYKILKILIKWNGTGWEVIESF